MPEGHTVHRLAGQVREAFAGRVVDVTSPQGRFAQGAALLDGARLVGTDAHGKHLLVGFAPLDGDGGSGGDGGRGGGTSPDAEADRWLRVHLGLYGKWTFGTGVLPAARGAVRLRMAARERPTGSNDPGDPGDSDGRDTDGRDTGTTTMDDDRPWAELRGPTACEVLDAADVAALHARLGPDPLRTADRTSGPADFAARVGASRTSVAALLMRQDVVAGVGNIYRAEALFRAGLAPSTPGREVPSPTLAAIWADLVVLMRAGVRAGRIVTTRPVDRGDPLAEPGSTVRQRGRAGAFYVYGRAGLPCRLCGTDVAVSDLAGRTLFWCPWCQRPGAVGPPWAASSTPAEAPVPVGTSL